jgi:hypothetical protein
LKIQNFAMLLAVPIAVTITVLLELSDSGHASLTSTFQDQIRSRKDDKQERDEFPIAVYSATLPSEAAERALRHARNSRYDKRYPVPFDELPPDTTEQLVACDWGLTSALPTAESDAVLSGRVLAANGYLSNDKTGAYSEFTIIIEEVLKKDGRSSLEPGNSIIVEREGAAVQLPSGRVLRTGFAGQGMPRIGRQYLLFLKNNDQGEDYHIVTGYELRNKRVFPVDSAEPFRIYKEADIGTFLNTVHQAVANPPEKKDLNR